MARWSCSRGWDGQRSLGIRSTSPSLYVRTVLCGRSELLYVDCSRKSPTHHRYQPEACDELIRFLDALTAAQVYSYCTVRIFDKYRTPPMWTLILSLIVCSTTLKLVELSIKYDPFPCCVQQLGPNAVPEMYSGVSTRQQYILDKRGIPTYAPMFMRHLPSNNECPPIVTLSIGLLRGKSRFGAKWCWRFSIST